MGVLLAIRDGQQTLVRLAEQWGLFPAIQALTELSRLGLIRIEMAPEPGVSGTAASHEQGAPHANRASPGSPALP
jgi:hypothetical protein